jgi:hypothetical protein
VLNIAKSLDSLHAADELEVLSHLKLLKEVKEGHFRPVESVEDSGEAFCNVRELERCCPYLQDWIMSSSESFEHHSLISQAILVVRQNAL